MEQTVRTILLTITESCNLDCIYCYESHKSRKHMSFETAIRVIDQELKNLPSGMKLNVSYMGGEPFLEFPLMKAIYEHYAGRGEERICYTNSTNGTLIHGEIKEWIREHAEVFSYNLSFDGIKKVQDYNRSNSFDKVDLNFYRQLYGEQGFVKMTLHPDTIDSLSESVQFIHSLGLKPMANCAYGCDWSAPETLSLFRRELVKLMEYYLQHPEIEPCSLLTLDLKPLAYQTIPKPWCGMDKMIVYDVEGVRHPCQFFEAMTLGNRLQQKAKGYCFDDLMELVPKECRSCAFFKLCPICIGSNYKQTGTFSQKDENLCRPFQLQLYANAVFWTEKIKAYGLDGLGLSLLEQKELLRGIQTVSAKTDASVIK